ncbi:Acetyltransferase (GNAT) family protein [Methylorubrum salsuginis]|uniref:Acetyltransferase (GNAT) family protein n=1 Tax=Methylorubrum salsuginis TaxID=414703 RepID=A0A1I3ZV85_9HYPH|nr:Acetyltransferase (GNAT) family protein [Methylorubrum salsuginis]
MPSPDLSSRTVPSARSVCRRLWPGDAAAVRAHFLRLDPDARASRFMAALGDAAVAAHAERAMQAPGLMFGVFVDDALRGLAELRPLGREGLAGRFGARAEGALAVERGFRCAGHGGLLLERLAEAARNRGVRELHLRCLPVNGAMRRLAARLGAEVRLRDGESEAALRLTRPTPLSLWREGVEGLLDLGLAVAAPASLPRAA